MPRASNAVIDTTQEDVAQGSSRKLKARGDARESLEPALIEPAERVIDKGWAENMAFANEIVTVNVHESTEKNAEPIVEVFCDGIPQRFVRGQDQDVKRKFVEVLARARTTRYSQRADNGHNFVEGSVFDPHTAIRYPFSMVRDDNPRGRDWLKSILQAA